MDDMILGHVLFDQMEGRTNGPDNEFRWDGEGWVGSDMNRLWFKSEGFVEHGLATDGDQEALYDRPITAYFDARPACATTSIPIPGASGVRSESRDWLRTSSSSRRLSTSATGVTLRDASRAPTIY
jgi:hypothetical protein